MSIWLPWESWFSQPASLSQASLRAVSQHSPSGSAFRAACLQLSALHHPMEREISLLLLLPGGSSSESMSMNVILHSAGFRSQDGAISFQAAASRNSHVRRWKELQESGVVCTCNLRNRNRCSLCCFLADGERGCKEILEMTSDPLQ